MVEVKVVGTVHLSLPEATYVLAVHEVHMLRNLCHPDSSSHSWVFGAAVAKLVELELNDALVDVLAIGPNSDNPIHLGLANWWHTLVCRSAWGHSEACGRSSYPDMFAKGAGKHGMTGQSFFSSACICGTSTV